MNESNLTTKHGLSDFALKYLAMVFMVLDHIHYFFEFTGGVPLVFSWIGRLAAPIFLFCVVEGFTHTHDRKKYFLRIYLLAIFMGLIQFSFYNLGAFMVRPDGFFPQNQMLASFVVLIVVLQGIDWCQQKKWLRGIFAIVMPMIAPFIVFGLMMQIPSLGFVLNLMAFSVLPLHTAIMDGGTATLLMGIVLYLTRKNRKVQAISYCVFVILWDVVRIILLAPNLGLMDYFTQAFEWMEIFAVVFMLCYNGEKGKGSKKLFYWFYPAHIYVLFGLSWIVYLVLQ